MMNGPWVLPRPRTAAELSEIGDWSVSVICAPIGFGKRTALSAWACEREREGIAVTWVDAATADDVLEEVKRSCSPQGQFAVIVTGFEAIEDVSVARELVLWGLRVPQGSCVVLSSNVVPDFGTIGLIPFMNCAVVEREAFLFDRNEVEGLYDARQIPEEERRTNYLVEQCGGWPFFVFAEFSPSGARLSKRRRQEQEDAYLEGLMRSIGERGRDFVERICFLDSIRLDLCDTLYGDADSGVDSALMIKQLERCGLLCNIRNDWWQLFPPLRSYDLSQSFRLRKNRRSDRAGLALRSARA